MARAYYNPYPRWSYNYPNFPNPTHDHDPTNDLKAWEDPEENSYWPEHPPTPPPRTETEKTWNLYELLAVVHNPTRGCWKSYQRWKRAHPVLGECPPERGYAIDMGHTFDQQTTGMPREMWDDHYENDPFGGRLQKRALARQKKLIASKKKTEKACIPEAKTMAETEGEEVVMKNGQTGMKMGIEKEQTGDRTGLMGGKTGSQIAIKALAMKRTAQKMLQKKKPLKKAPMRKTLLKKRHAGRPKRYSEEGEERLCYVKGVRGFILA